MMELRENVKRTTFPTMLSLPPIEKQLKKELSTMHQRKPKMMQESKMSVRSVVLSSYENCVGCYYDSGFAT